MVRVCSAEHFGAVAYEGKVLMYLYCRFQALINLKAIGI